VAIRKTWTMGLALCLLGARLAAAQDQIALVEVLGSWQGDDTIQFVELVLLADGQQATANVGELVFDTAAAEDGTRRFFVFTANVTGNRGGRVLVATNGLAALSGLTADFTLPTGLLAPRDGRVCYQVRDAQGSARLVDCVAYGRFTGPALGLGPPAPSPDNRSLARLQVSGSNRADWEARLTPMPETNVGTSATLQTLCGDGRISQGEECDGLELGEATCASLDFSSGKLACMQCHFDTTRCSFCGNDALNAGEDCDGAELGGKTCETIGYSGGTLACSPRCKLSAAECTPPFFVPGAGGPKRECMLAWRIDSATGGPSTDGTVAARLRCRDGDARCDADTTAGTCTFRVSACVGRADPRLPGCTAHGTSEWTLLKPVGPDPAALALVPAVAALGASTVVGGTVTFSPALDAAAHCTDSVALAVPVRGRLRLKARATAVEGKPRDVDPLTLICTP
jgi:hypothetical protein